MIHTREATTTAQSRDRMKSGEEPAEDEERDDDRRFDDDHADVGPAHVGVGLLVIHRAALRSARRRSAPASALVAFFHQSSSETSWAPDAAAARIVCSGAGPPKV